MTTPGRNVLMAILLLCCWGVVMLFAFWWFEGRYLRSFSEQASFFDGNTLQLPDEIAGPGIIRVVHFWDPACPCNVGNQQHLSELISRFAPQGVMFRVVQKTGSRGDLPGSLSALKPLHDMVGVDTLAASPAVAIWGRDGGLAYLGPYSEGATCTSSNSFIEPILEALIAGRSVKADNNMAVGCFCNWSR